MTVTSVPRLDALAVFDAVLSRAATGAPGTLTVSAESGAEQQVDAASWCRPQLAGDHRLLGGCAGPTLDVGCGPGRLTSALNRLGLPALGIDISATAVRLARARGATALRRDVFGALPGHGRWRHLLLADGNIGIGGNPSRLLRRCRELLAPGGQLHVELAPPGSGSWSGRARLTAGDGTASEPFPWAVLAVDDLPAPAAACALRVRTTWMESNRWFATLILN